MQPQNVKITNHLIVKKSVTVQISTSHKQLF